MAKKKVISKKMEHKESKKDTRTEKKSKSNSLQDTKKFETKKVNPNIKKILMISSAIIIIICILIFIYILPTSGSVTAQLVIDSGSVYIKHSSGDWVAAEDGMLLYQSDSIKTDTNSSASIILFKTSIIRLSSETEITIKSIIQEEKTSVSIQQDSGRTWSTIQKISGVDNYEVQTPTAVASVRGTSFDVDVKENETTIVNVIAGLVNVTKISNVTVYTVDIGDGYSVTITKDEISDPEPFTPDEWITNNLLEDDLFIQDLKDILYARLDPYMDDLKTNFGMSDEEIETLVKGFIEGKFPIPSDLPDQYKDIFDLT